MKIKIEKVDNGFILNKTGPWPTGTISSFTKESREVFKEPSQVADRVKELLSENQE